MLRQEGPLKLTENARTVLEKRYLKKDSNGMPLEKPEDMLRRVANNIAQADRFYDRHSDARRTEDDFYSLMANLDFLPNSPTLMNAGRDLQQLSACFVLPIEDSMEGIFETLKSTALIHKCLVPETLVMTRRGLAQLKDIKSKDKVFTDEGFFEVKDLHDNGEQLVFDVITEHGYSIKGTAEHKLLAVAENGEYIWLPIGELKGGDWLILKPGLWSGKKVKFPEFCFKEKSYVNSGCFRPQEVKIPGELTEELAEFIGLYIGDGSNHRDGIRFTIGNADPDLIEIVRKASLGIFGRDITVSKDQKKGACEVSVLSVIIKKWFEEAGITKPCSKNAAVPKFIFEAEEKLVCAFLRGLFSADGCVRENGHVTFVTGSIELAAQIQKIMLYLGIPIHKKYYPNTDSFQLSICSKQGFINFKKKIGFLNKRKQDRLEAVSSEEIFLRGECIPNQRHRLKKWYKDLPFGQRKLIVKRIDGIIYDSAAQRQLSKQVAVDILENEEIFPEFLKDLTSENFVFDKVAKVSPLAVKKVYDITVPYKHAYVADGFVSHNSGGGTGYSFSRLRSQGSQVKSTSGIASGPISFLKVFDAATQAVKQGGTRRGANMGILRIDHPDILEFITCKEDDKSITNFNISVAVTDDFMNKVVTGEEYDLIDPHTSKPVDRLNAKEVFDLMVKQSHKNGEPGIIFIDRMNKDNATPKLGQIESTNPCGEQPLLPYESCNLGSINLAKMLVDKDAKYEIDWQKLAKTTHMGVHFLDNVIDMNKYPVKRIEQVTRSNRKIGLGVMGFADMLIALGIPYNSDEAVNLAETLMKFILDEATKASVDLSKKRNPFPNFRDSIYAGGSGLRNATLTTIAPTGTLSIIASCSSGIEPIFSICYYRKVLDGAKLMEVNPYFEKIAKERNFYSEELMKKISQHSTIQDMKEIPEDVRKIFVTAHDITPLWHIKMQSAFQKYTNNAVSKTVNFSYDASPEDVKEVYTLAYKLGCKGVTIYRDGSRSEQVLNIDRGTRTTEKQVEVKEGSKEAIQKEERSEELDKVIQQLQPSKEKIAPRPRPKVVCGTTTKIQTGCGNLYVTINEDENGRPFEVFTQMGKAGGCAASQLEAVGRLVSLALRSGIDIKSIIDQLEGIRCPSPSWEKGGRIFSCADALAKVIERILLKKNKPQTPDTIKTLASDNNKETGLKSSEILGKDTNGRGEEFGDMQYFGKTAVKTKVNDVVGVCPDCGGALHYQEGCMICHSCAFTKCG